jgi:hypothetical protein
MFATGRAPSWGARGCTTAASWWTCPRRCWARASRGCTPPSSPTASPAAASCWSWSRPPRTSASRSPLLPACAQICTKTSIWRGPALKLAATIPHARSLRIPDLTDFFQIWCLACSLERSLGRAALPGLALPVCCTVIGMLALLLCRSGRSMIPLQRPQLARTGMQRPTALAPARSWRSSLQRCALHAVLGFACCAAA